MAERSTLQSRLSQGTSREASGAQGLGWPGVEEEGNPEAERTQKPLSCCRCWLPGPAAPRGASTCLASHHSALGQDTFSAPSPPGRSLAASERVGGGPCCLGKAALDGQHMASQLCGLPRGHCASPLFL